MALQERLDLGALACFHGVELGYDLAATHDPEVLAAVLDGVEEVGEVPGCVGSAHLRHEIRLSDSTAQNVDAPASLTFGVARVRTADSAGSMTASSIGSVIHQFHAGSHYGRTDLERRV